MTVEQLVGAFLEWISARRKPNTLKLYRDRLKPFRIKFGVRDWLTLLPLEIDAYLLSVNTWPDGRSKAPDTVRANAIALEQLQKFAADKVNLDQKIVSDLEKPIGRWRERLPTESELAALLAHSSPQFALIYQALRQSGARPNELARATRADWDQSAGVITLTDHKTATKSKRPRVIPVGEKLRAILEQASGGRQPRDSATDNGQLDNQPLFVTPRGQPWTSASLSQTFARVRLLAMVDPSVKLYSARHEFGTACCAALGREAAADQMGHADTKTTRRYDHVTKAKLRSNQDAVNL